MVNSLDEVITNYQNMQADYFRFLNTLAARFGKTREEMNFFEMLGNHDYQEAQNKSNALKGVEQALGLTKEEIAWYDAQAIQYVEECG